VGLVIRIETLDIRYSRVSFRPFSERALKTVKSVEGRQYDPEDRTWFIPTPQVSHVVRRLHAVGETVMVDGQGYDPLRAAAATNPFVPLLTALPEKLRDRVLNSLICILGPASEGGDADLFAQLCQAGLVIENEEKIAANLQAPAKPRATKRPETKPVRRLVRR
jgi:hypothetical protein